jgi:ferredoxin
MSALHFISDAEFPRWLSDLACARDLLIPRRLDGDWTFSPLSGEGKAEPSPYRAIESLKSFLFSGRETVARFPGTVAPASRPRALVGLKACDLAALPVLDYIFLQGNCADPFYRQAREETLLVSQDCAGFKEVCFCPVVGGRPHPLRGFDLNLTPLPGGCLVETGSEKGEAIIRDSASRFRGAKEEEISSRTKLREKVLGDLKDLLKKQGQLDKAPAAARVKEKSRDPLWKEEAVPCVECGACNLVCPACHCFILEESPAREGSVRLRNWDSCQYPGFSREAGGSNPRTRRSERLSNRFSKKFQFFPDLIGALACTGCGRCVEACMGKIDIRKILKRIESE